MAVKTKKVTRDRIVAASIFHVIRSYLLIHKGNESFKGVKFAIDPVWSGWERLHFYLTRYISEGGGTIVHSDSDDAEVAIPFTASNMVGNYGIVIPAIPGAVATNKNSKAVELPATFSTLYDMVYRLIDHNDTGAYNALKAVANAVYDAAFHYFYEQRELDLI